MASLFVFFSVVHNRPKELGSETTGSRPQLLTEIFPGTGRAASSREMTATRLVEWTNGEGATVKVGPMAEAPSARRRVWSSLSSGCSSQSSRTEENEETFVAAVQIPGL